MAVPDSDRTRTVHRLLSDVAATIGPGHEAAVSAIEINAAALVDEPSRYRDKLVEDVQQYFHDCFVDTSWPACPRHSQHPLWLRGEHWYCDRDGEAIAKLGELRRQ